jgi:hypothetical protein
MKESRNSGASDFVFLAYVKAFRLIYLNERVARPLFVFVELTERLAYEKNIYGCLRVRLHLANGSEPSLIILLGDGRVALGSPSQSAWLISWRRGSPTVCLCNLKVWPSSGRHRVFPQVC